MECFVVGSSNAYDVMFCSWFAGAKVFIDSKAQMTLLGTVMDYVDEKLTSEFVFENPNVTGFCGCGESFSLDKSIFSPSKPPKKESSAGEGT